MVLSLGPQATLRSRGDFTHTSRIFPNPDIGESVRGRCSDAEKEGPVLLIGSHAGHHGSIRRKPFREILACKSA